MNHAPILPILIPLLAALVQLMGHRLGIRFQRVVGTIASIALVMASLWLLRLSDAGATLVYALGDWPAPFGIVLVADRMAAIAVTLVALLALPCLLYASAGFDDKGRHFQPMFQLQLVGLNGAFLTGDLFNLFVFFEVLLLASYILLAQGGGLARSRAGFAYLVLNLVGSAVFLIALGLIYGTLGTLNLADIAQRLQQIGLHEVSLVRLAAALLITVFALKAALLPLSFWLPQAYAAAGAPVAALFVIMTKVGVYSMLRVQMVAFAPASATADILQPWLMPLALATLAISALGALAATRLQSLLAWLVLGSAGTLLLTPAFADAAVSAAALYYLLQSTLVAAALFLLTDLIASRRGSDGDRLLAAKALGNTGIRLGFLILAATAAGLPPFSGFLGKLMLLRSMQQSAVWAVILITGLLFMLALARAGSQLFWEQRAQAANMEPVIAGRHSGRMQIGATVLLGSLSLGMMLFAQPLTALTQRAAEQLHNPDSYIAAVLGQRANSIERQVRPR